jgi:hypothetical protein
MTMATFDPDWASSANFSFDGIACSPLKFMNTEIGRVEQHHCSTLASSFEAQDDYYT